MQIPIYEIISGAAGFILGNLTWLIVSHNGDSTQKQEIIATNRDKIGGAGKRWTDYDHRFLIENKDLPNQALANALERSVGAIKSKKNELNITDNSSRETHNKSKPKTESIPEVNLSSNEIDKIVEQLDLSNKKAGVKLEPTEVVEIYLSDQPPTDLAKKFNVDRKTIIHIWSKEIWEWLTDQVDEIMEYNKYKQPKEISSIGDILDQVDLDGTTPPASRKLTPEDVIRIYLSKENRETLSKIFDCSESNIRFIRDKTSWNWLTDQVDSILDSRDKRIDLEPSQRNKGFF